MMKTLDSWTRPLLFYQPPPPPLSIRFSFSCSVLFRTTCKTVSAHSSTLCAFDFWKQNFDKLYIYAAGYKREFSGMWGRGQAVGMPRII